MSGDPEIVGAVLVGDVGAVVVPVTVMANGASLGRAATVGDP